MGKLIEPRILGFNPVDADTSALFVADKDNNEYKVFDSEGELYTPDGGVVSTRLDALEAGIPPIDDARIVVLEGAKAQNDIDVADLQSRMTTVESDIDAVEVTVAAEQLLLDQAQTDITNLQDDMTKHTHAELHVHSNSVALANVSGVNTGDQSTLSMMLTGYVIANLAALPSETDTINQAFGKLAKTVDGIETLLAAI